MEQCNYASSQRVFGIGRPRGGDQGPSNHCRFPPTPIHLPKAMIESFNDLLYDIHHIRWLSFMPRGSGNGNRRGVPIHRRQEFSNFKFLLPPIFESYIKAAFYSNPILFNLHSFLASSFVLLAVSLEHLPLLHSSSTSSNGILRCINS